ncbi:hypothetical protein M0R45_008966 [Rubus argutus]|uniref:Uncharacterized protein n=1 Tax=Rubus argutus TaxID=59490 RepID=A0AAW1Y3L8_RUBAR
MVVRRLRRGCSGTAVVTVVMKGDVRTLVNWVIWVAWLIDRVQVFRPWVSWWVAVMEWTWSRVAAWVWEGIKGHGLGVCGFVMGRHGDGLTVWVIGHGEDGRERLIAVGCGSVLLLGVSDSDYTDFASNILHLKGDRKDFDFVKSSLSTEGFNVVYDINGLEAEEINKHAMIFCILLTSYLTIIIESEKLTITRYLGKPVYTVGLLEKINGNSIGRDVIVICQQVFNFSVEKYVTFDGLSKACAKAAGFPEREIVHYNPKEFDFGKRRHFYFVTR